MFKQIKYKLNIKVVDDNPILVKYYSEFKQHYSGDSGIDLYSFQSHCDVRPFEVFTVDFNIQCELINIETNEFESYYLVPRSSISNTVFQLCNSVGIIDAAYRGNIKAKVRNLSESRDILEEGKYFQIVAPDLSPISVSLVDTLSSTMRGDNGFGSTNKKE